MLSANRGSVTVGAMLGTGLVTLGVALTGLAGMGDDLRAASVPAVQAPIYDGTIESPVDWNEHVRTQPGAGATFCPPEEAAERARLHERRQAAAERALEGQRESAARDRSDARSGTTPAPVQPTIYPQSGSDI